MNDSSASSEPVETNAPAAFSVGDLVVIRDVNEKRRNPDGPRTGYVVKVGRTLLQVQPEGSARTTNYRKESRRTNDAYGHGWIQTPEEYDAEQRRQGVVRSLRDLGLELSLGKGRSIPIDLLERVLNVLEPDAAGASDVQRDGQAP